MVAETSNSPASKLKVWCRKWLLAIVLLLIVCCMIVWIVYLAISDKPDKPSWLLVPLTVIYAVLTLMMAAAALQNSAAALRSAQAMEASVEEQRQSRFAAFGAVISFPDGLEYRLNTDGSATIVLGNIYRQPIMDLCVRLWLMESERTGKGLVKYSTMMESAPIDVEADTASVTVQLTPTTKPESERVKIGDIALQRYRDVFRNEVPRSCLCLITYYHRASLNHTLYVYDLQRTEQQE